MEAPLSSQMLVISHLSFRPPTIAGSWRLSQIHSFTSKTNQHCTVVTSCQIHRYRVAWWLLIVAQPGFRLAANISLSNFTLQGWSQVLTMSTTVYKFCCCWDHKLRGSRFSYQRLRAGWNEGWTWWSSWLTHQPTPKPNLPQNLKPMVSFHCRRI